MQSFIFYLQTEFYGFLNIRQKGTTVNITPYKHNHSGFYIAVEGVDGAGKTEATRLLKEAIEKHFPEKELVCFRAPGGTEVGEKIRSILLNSKSITNRAELLLFIASHVETLNNVVFPALQRGAIVLSDRFIESTYAYQGAGRDLEDEVSVLHQFFLDKFYPDHTVFISVDASVANQRIESRGDANRLDLLVDDTKAIIAKRMRKTISNYENDPKLENRMTVIENNYGLEDLSINCEDWVLNFKRALEKE